MMKKPIILLLLVLMLLMSFGCSGPIHTNPQETINTSVGKEFTIGLHVTKRLGASWQVSYDEEMLTLEHEKYIDDNSKSPGLSGTQKFSFEAARAGETQIEFSLKHGTTGPISEQKVFNVDIK